MKKFLLFPLIVIVAAVFVLPAAASTFCIAGYGMAPQCIYDDVRQCIKASEPPGTSCTVNQQAVLSYVGGSAYCVVTSDLVAQCIYVDRNQCNEQARRQQAACIERDAMSRENDPYRYDPRVQR